MIDLNTHPEGVIVSIRAQPGAKKNGITGEHAGAVRVAVTAAPERGRANEAVAEVLAEALGCRGSRITLLSGETSRSKRFLVRDLAPDEIQARLSKHIARS